MVFRKGDVPWNAGTAAFWSYVDRSGDCWLWTGPHDEKGYGRAFVNQKTKLAHRHSYELANGPIVGEAFVCHSCDTPACVNPAHLWLGDAKLNALDALKKGRHPTVLTRETVAEIRRLHANGEQQNTLARSFGVSKSNIHKIVHRMTWTI